MVDIHKDIPFQSKKKLGDLGSISSKVQNNTTQLVNTAIKIEDVINVKEFKPVGGGLVDDTTAFLQAIQVANGRPIEVHGTYKVSLDLTDEHVHFVGTGTLIHDKGKNVIKVKRTLGNAIPINSISTIQIGASNPAIGVATETNTKIMISGSLSGISQGDVFHISSQDIYPFCTQMTANKGTNIQVWKAGFVPVHGIGLDVSGVTGGGFTENDTVTGLTSGATAVILSKSDTTVVFGKATGDFVSGESLQVSGTTRGTANGTPYIIMAGKLVDTYPTSPVLRKLPTDKKFIIDGLSVKASGDVDSIVGSANRKTAFLLMGVHSPIVKNFTIESAWTRCFQLQSCYKGDLDVRIKKLPNNANESESAYGYGVELAGATEGCKVRVNGGNCRHGFTTNVIWGGFQYMDALTNGTIKYNTVHDSVIENAISASFDTHEGAYFTTFENCRSINSRSGLRNITASGGFQNRGFGTTYRNCHDDGSVIGFIENGILYESGFVNYNQYIDCTSDNYQQYGFQQVSNAPSNNTHLEFINCSARGDGSPVNVPYYQAGFYLRSGVTTLRNCSSSRFNGAPFQFGLAGGRFSIIDCFADYFDCPSFTSGLRFDGAPSEFNLQNYKVRPSPFATNSPAGMLRIASGAVAVNVDGISSVSSATPPPLAEVSGGSITINHRSAISSVRPTATNGDVSITVLPGDLAPIKFFNAPLTADRTVTLSTATGTVLNGYTLRIVRQAAATGSFNLTVGAGLKVLQVGQWCEVTYNGSSWMLTASGTL